MNRRLFLTASGLLGLPSAVRAAELWVGGGAAARPADDIMSTLAERRERQIRRVEVYARRGVFPRNLDFRGERVPYFLDDRGVPCAVAHLMIEDGLRAEVERIKAQNNHVRVLEVREGPLVEWVLTSGLLQEEAARIQPSYDFMDRPRPRPIVTPDPAIVERTRIQRHLFAVARELRASSAESLRTAELRLGRRAGG